MPYVCVAFSFFMIVIFCLSQKTKKCHRQIVKIFRKPNHFQYETNFNYNKCCGNDSNQRYYLKQNDHFVLQLRTQFSRKHTKISNNAHRSLLVSLQMNFFWCVVCYFHSIFFFFLFLLFVDFFSLYYFVWYLSLFVEVGNFDEVSKALALILWRCVIQIHTRTERERNRINSADSC